MYLIVVRESLLYNFWVVAVSLWGQSGRFKPLYLVRYDIFSKGLGLPKRMGTKTYQTWNVPAPSVWLYRNGEEKHISATLIQHMWGTRSTGPLYVQAWHAEVTCNQLTFNWRRQRNSKKIQLLLPSEFWCLVRFLPKGRNRHICKHLRRTRVYNCLIRNSSRVTYNMVIMKVLFTVG